MRLDRKTSIKVPEITVLFWVIKVLTTGMGEATSDFFIHRVGVSNKAGLAVVGLATGLALGARARPAVLGHSLRPLDLLARRRDGRRVRHDGCRRGPRWTRGALRRLDAFFSAVLAVSSSSGSRARRRCRSTASTPHAARPSIGRSSSRPSPWAPLRAT